MMDEPTSALDPAATAAVEALIARLGRGRTVLMVTHDLAQARRLADRLVCLLPRAGSGELAAAGPAADLFARPPAAEVAAYLRPWGESPPALQRELR